MGNFKYKIKEASEVLKATEVDPALIQRIEKTYGPMDMENDFFSANLKTYFKTSSVNPESGSVGHRIIKLASFTDVLEKLYSSTNALSDLVASPGGKDDAMVVKIYDDLKTIFNRFRTHLRKYYPDQYAAIKDKLDEMSSVGGGAGQAGFTSGTEGENYATKYAFKKKVTEGPGATLGPGPKAGPEGVTNNTYVKNFKYTLVNKKALNKAAKGIEVKQLWEADFDVNQLIKDQNITNPAMVDWISKRVEAFDTLERQLNQLIPMLQQAKKETIRKYSQNPSFAVIYGTDLAQEYLQDIIELFKQQQ
jgi:hypothetical protein